MDVAATWAAPVATSVETWLLLNVRAWLLALGIDDLGRFLEFDRDQ